MNVISGILSNQAPAKQTATATIATLCDRLAHGTLLEDRRAAVQGLRSFAREYKETVASEGLRGLIATLSKDIEDIDTVKVVLETLLLLFVKDDQNPESLDDIALWLTDEFTQKQNNISLLIDLLEKTDFYARLYTLQLLVAITENRPERTRECIFTAPLGITRLVSILDDNRDIIRNEGVQLLTALTKDNPDIQKLVAFENAFDRIFDIINKEGGIDGGVTVQDCLYLLSSLLTFNASNQSFFRETSCVPRLGRLLDVQDEAPGYAKDIRTINICLTLNICGLFVVPNSTGTVKNQLLFWQTGITLKALNLAFSTLTDEIVRAKALTTVADMIRSNSDLQQNFARVQVDDLTLALSGKVAEGALGKVYVIEGLLDLALLQSPNISFPIRLAASRCVEGYFFDNEPIRMHFLNRAKDGFSAGADETANILASLMELDSDSRADPYRTWLSATVFLHLINENEEIKNSAMGLTSGDAESGEEVVTAIQSFSANLISSVQYKLDQRISIAFFMVLCIWLFDNPPAVNDFLNEGSMIQSLVGIVAQSNNPDIIVQGLGAFLLGIIYEFSSDESPVPRSKLHTILSGIGRDQYVYKLGLLRKHPWIRDFELNDASGVISKTSAPVHFDTTFIDFLKDNYSLILRAIDKYPGKNAKTNGEAEKVQTITVDIYDSVKAQLESKEEELVKAQTSLLSLEHQVSQEQEEMRRLKESSATTIQRIKEVAAQQIASARDQNQDLIEQYEADMAGDREDHLAALQNLEQQRDEAYETAKLSATQVSELEAEKGKLTADIWELQQQIEQLNSQLNMIVRNHTDEMASLNTEIESHKTTQENLSNLHQEEKTRLLSDITDRETQITTLSDNRKEELLSSFAKAEEEKGNLKQSHLSELAALRAQLDSQKEEVSKLARLHSDEINSLNKSHTKEITVLKNQKSANEISESENEKRKSLSAKQELSDKVEQLEKELEETNEKMVGAQTERDDLMLVMGDLEERTRGYKQRLKALKEEVSDDDDGDEEEAEEDEDDEGSVE